MVSPPFTTVAWKINATPTSSPEASRNNNDESFSYKTTLTWNLPFRAGKCGFRCLIFADQKLLEECCDAEGWEFSHPTLTLPQFGIPLTTLVGFQSFFPVWRVKKRFSVPCHWVKNPFLMGKWVRSCLGREILEGGHMLHPQGALGLPAQVEMLVEQSCGKYSPEQDSAPAVPLEPLAKREKPQKNPKNPPQPLQQLQEQTHGCDGGEFSPDFLGAAAQGWTGAPGEENSSTAGKHQKFFCRGTAQEVVPSYTLAPVPRTRLRQSWVQLLNNRRGTAELRFQVSCQVRERSIWCFQHCFKTWGWEFHHGRVLGLIFGFGGGWAQCVLWHWAAALSLLCRPQVGCLKPPFSISPCHELFVGLAKPCSGF